MHARRFVVSLTMLAILPALAAAEPRLNALFSDGGVLQRDIKVPIFGFANPKEEITVSIQDQKVTTTADATGRWVATLDPLKAGGPFEMTVAGAKKVLTVRDLLVGEVWICSGQSNMEWPLSVSADAQEAIAAANHPKIRLFHVPRQASPVPLTEVPQTTVANRKVPTVWKPCTSQNAASFSAVGYHFGLHLHKALNVPIGLINSSWGGTSAQAWTSKEALEAEPVLKHYVESLHGNHQKALAAYLTTVEKYLATAKKAVEESKPIPEPPTAPVNPASTSPVATALFNGMIAPLIPYGIRGVIWYQGESNASRPTEYRTLMPTLIKDWRSRWGQGDFVFAQVQLAPFENKNYWPELREAQLLTAQTLPKAGIVVITDVGHPTDIHPKQKEPVGYRLSLVARALAHGEKIAFSGPVYKGMEIKGDRIELAFDHVGGGLEAKGGSLKGFTICGKDRVFVPAEAEIKGDRIVVHSPKVADPIAVRFGWVNYPEVNLWNKDGLPATPFRTDDFPSPDQVKK